MTNLKQLDAVEADSAAPAKGWSIKIKGKFYPIPNDSDNAVDGAIKKAGLWKKGGTYPDFEIYHDGEREGGGGGGNSGRMDSSECDTIYQEKGEFFFRKPGFRDAYGPFASEDEANEAAVRAGVIADAGRLTHTFGKRLAASNAKTGVPVSNRTEAEIYAEDERLRAEGERRKDAKGRYPADILKKLDKNIRERDGNRQAARERAERADAMDPITLMADASSFSVFVRDYGNGSDPNYGKSELGSSGFKSLVSRHNGKILYGADKGVGLTFGSEAEMRSFIREVNSKHKDLDARQDSVADADDPCWEGYHAEGMKEKDGKTVPNCIPDAAPQPLIAEDRKYWKRECRDRIQDATASIKSYEEDLKRAESKLAHLGADAKPSQKQSLQADLRDYKDLIRQQRMRLKSAQETLEMVDKPNTTSEQIEAVWRKNKYADSATADAGSGYTEIWADGNLDQEIDHNGNYKAIIKKEVKDLREMGCKVKTKSFDGDGNSIRLDSDTEDDCYGDADPDFAKIAKIVEKYEKSRKDNDAEADAAVSFDKGNPEKPWSVKVGSSIKRFAFRQQAEAAARGDAEADSGERTLAQAEEELRLVKRSLNNAYAKNGYKAGGSQDKMRSKFETLEAEIKSIKSRKDSAKADANNSDGAEFTIKYTSKANKTESVKVRATNAQEATNKLKRALGSEIFAILETKKTSDARQAGINQRERSDAEADAEPTRNQRFGFGNPNASKDQLFAFLKTCAPVSDAQLAGLLQVSYGIKPSKARSVVSDFKSSKDSAKADSTPTIVREGDQWIIQVTNGAEKSVFRLGVREYPTEAEALEYATTNPQYTNNKPTNALDSLMAACDSLYAKADEIERRLDAAGDQRFSVVYINSVDREATIVVRAKHNVDAKKVAKDQLGGEIKEIRRVEQLPDRK